jgi:hypothetical protein
MSLMSIKIFVSSPGDVAQVRFLTERVLTRLQNVYRHVCRLERQRGPRAEMVQIAGRRIARNSRLFALRQLLATS